jgi:hypothetical protein
MRSNGQEVQSFCFACVEGFGFRGFHPIQLQLFVCGTANTGDGFDLPRLRGIHRRDIHRMDIRCRTYTPYA